MERFGGDGYRPYSSSGHGGSRRDLGLGISTSASYPGRHGAPLAESEAGPSRASFGSSSGSPASAGLPPMLPSPAALFGSSSATTTSATTPQQLNQDGSGQTSSVGPRRVGGKANVASACGPCKRAHLACDVGRPCKRCINMGKQDQCEDVPHKKRGRPKASRASMGDPYSRPRQPLPGASDRYRSSPYEYHPQVPSGYESSLYSSRGGHVDRGPIHYPPPREPAKVDTFTVIATTDLRVARASASSFALTGYHPEEFFNLSIVDWVHPSDRFLLEQERKNLVSVPFLPRLLVSDRDVLAALTCTPERELLTPAEGMREYPQQNVRVLRADSQYSLFNARLHLGGGLGASLWRPASLGRVYIVISFLLMTDRLAPPPATGRGERPADRLDDPRSRLSPRDAPLPMPPHVLPGVGPEPPSSYTTQAQTQRSVSQPNARLSPALPPGAEISPRAASGQGLPSLSSITGGITLPPLSSRPPHRSVSPLPYRPSSREARPLDRYAKPASESGSGHLNVPPPHTLAHAGQAPTPAPTPPYGSRDYDHRVPPYGYPSDPRSSAMPRRDSIRDEPFRAPFGEERAAPPADR